MLGHFGSGRRRHQRRAGRNVEGERSPAAGADHVHQFVALRVRERQRRDPLAHHLDKAGQLRRLFAARGQNSEQRRGLDFGHSAGENLFEHGCRLLASQRRAILGQRLQ